MDWALKAVLMLTVLVAVSILLRSQTPGRKRKREDFAHFIKVLLWQKENGGWLHIQQRRADLAFDIVRAEGGDDDAVLILRVPRASWSKQHGTRLRDLFESHLLDVRLLEAPTSEALLEVRIPVENIWEEWCGAKGARAAHLLLDAVDVPRDARFDLSIHGPSSTRGLRREWQRLHDGRA